MTFFEVKLSVRMTKDLSRLVDSWVVGNRDRWENPSAFIRAAILRADKQLRLEGVVPQQKKIQR